MPSAVLSPSQSRSFHSNAVSAPKARPEFFASYDDIRAFVLREWERELDYRLKQESWTYKGDRISVRFEYEWHDTDADRWMRTRGTERWVIAADGLIHCLGKEISDEPIQRAAA